VLQNYCATDLYAGIFVEKGNNIAEPENIPAAVVSRLLKPVWEGS
jgi:hypothetical protein